MNDTNPSTDRDEDALRSLEKKLHLVRDHCTAVAKGYQTGYYLFGTGGVGKSYAVLRQLESLDVAYHSCSTRG